MIKNEQQINGIRKSCKIVSDIYKMIDCIVDIGVTTNDINDLVAKLLKDTNSTSASLNYGNKPPYFPKECCISVNETAVHGIPDDYVLRDGDILSIDVALSHDGYYGDACRSYGVGNLSEKSKRILETSIIALGKGIAACKPNANFSEIGSAIEGYVDTTPFSVIGCFCGHGVGLQMHEHPQIYHVYNEMYDGVMVPGMIFTIEPVITDGNRLILHENQWAYSQGTVCAQFEDTILITENGYEILTK